MEHDWVLGRLAKWSLQKRFIILHEAWLRRAQLSRQSVKYGRFVERSASIRRVQQPLAHPENRSISRISSRNLLR